MKIKSMSDQILVIIDNNTFGIIIGIIFVFFGLIMLKPEIVNVKQDVPVLMAIIFILLGVLTIIIPTHDLVIFDKKNNLLTVKHKSIIPFLRSSEKCNLAQIKKSSY